MGTQSNTTGMDNLVALKTHQPCEDCGSSDALTINVDGSTKCYSCGEFKPKGSGAVEVPDSEPMKRNGFVQGEHAALPSRLINEDTCRKYSYKVGAVNGKPCHIANYYNLDGGLVAQKYRMPDKSFRCSGTPSYFFGQHIWPNGGRKVVITEGEIDALTVSQLNGNKWPAVSLPSGAQSAKSVFKKHMEWLNLWEEVILMFDNDEQGRKAVEQVVDILPAGKCKIAKLPLKDPNEMLVAGRGEEVIRAFWDAKVWRPDDIVDGSELLERLTTPKINDSIPYPFSGLNESTKGIRRGEIVTFCAGSGIGKSHVCKCITHHILTTSENRIGYIALEESIERTANGILGLELGRQLHIEPFTPDEAYNEGFKKTVGSGRFFLYDHWGSMEPENLISHIRYMAKALDVEYVVLDHLSIVVSGLSEGDERRTIDNMMTKLRSLVEETNIGLILVSHLKRPEGKGHEDGAITSLAQLRGSASIAQLSDIVIGLERNQQDVEDRHKSSVRVLKNRFTGETGVACSLLYDKITGRMTEDSLDTPF